MYRIYHQAFQLFRRDPTNTAIAFIITLTSIIVAFTITVAFAIPIVLKVGIATFRFLVMFIELINVLSYHCTNLNVHIL